MGKEKKHKRDRHKEKKKKNKRKQSSSSSASSDDEWVEKPTEIISNATVQRDEWLSLPSNFLTASTKEMKQVKKEAKSLQKQGEQYDPKSNIQELNPYWRENGTGLPGVSFKKPIFDNEDETHQSCNTNHHSNKSICNWRRTSDKIKADSSISENDKISMPQQNTETLMPTSKKDLNILAAKIVKAEIMGNTDLAKKLTEQLEAARKVASEIKDEQVLLTQTDSKGYTRPLERRVSEIAEKPLKKRKTETHCDGERVRYFHDDDKYSLKKMFEEEKFNSSDRQNAEFLSALGKSNRSDDLDDIFSDKIRSKNDESKEQTRERDRAITEHQKISKRIEKCKSCPDMMERQLLVTIRNDISISVPSHEPLTDGHCLICPVRHVISSTHLDEDEWAQIMDIRRKLTSIFAKDGRDVIFFEVACEFHRHPHMRIECIPVDKEFGDMAPIYFKKAIDESEVEWSTNKKLVKLQGKNVRRAVPKGLPYFFVSFGMQEGYAHVIEDEQLFPKNFAQEIIAGAMDLDHRKWKRPRQQNFEEQKKRSVGLKKLWSTCDDD